MGLPHDEPVARAVALDDDTLTDAAGTIGGISECPECEAETEVIECPDHERCPKCCVCGYCDVCAWEVR